MSEPDKDSASERADTPAPPANWRDMFESDYRYPDDLPRGVLRGRRARRRWRTEDRRARRAWVSDRYEEARREEPPSPVAFLVVAALLVGTVLGLGLLARTVLLSGDDVDKQTQSATDPSSTLATSPDSTSSSTGLSETSTTSAGSSTSEPPSGAESPEPAESLMAPAKVIKQWSTVFYTRDPRGREESYDELLERSQAWMTPELVANLAQAGDPTYEELNRTGTKSRVTAVTVTQPLGNVPSPADTPVRVSRVVRVSVALTPGGDRFEVPLLIELRRGEDGWLIGTLTGDSHHE